MITVESKRNQIKNRIKIALEVWENAPESDYKTTELERLNNCAARLNEVVYLSFLADIRAMIDAGKNIKDIKKDQRSRSLDLQPDDYLYSTVTQNGTTKEFNYTALGDEIVTTTMQELGYSVHIPTTQELKRLEIAKDIALANWYADHENEELKIKLITAERDYAVASASAGYVTFSGGLPVDLPSIKHESKTQRKEANKTSKVLGLSATPIRYLDNLRDMAEELLELFTKSPFYDEKSEEINIKINKEEVDNYIKVFSSIGYPLCFQIKKEREVYTKDNITITIDRWPIIGYLIEIEGEESKIKEVAKQIAQEKEFGNLRLKDLFKDKMDKENKTIEELKKEYYNETNFDLGKIELILKD